MFISCPHCRDLVALDRKTRLPPAICARCGGALQETTGPETTTIAGQAADSTAPGFVSLLHGKEAAETAGTTSEITAIDGTVHQADGEDAIAADAEPDIAGMSDMAEMNAQPVPVTQEEPPQPEPLLLAAPTPSFTRQVARAPTHPRAARWQWAALVVLSLLLVLQVLIADRARLAADAGWRPLIIRICGALGCSVPAWHQPGAFAMLSRDVRPIADAPGGLHVQATFRNDARWPQPWPVLLLSLSDADGRVLGARAFTPGEYLGADASQAELAPGQSARIALRLREPNPDVVAFSFDFR